MALTDVILGWIQAGVESGEAGSLSPEQQRELCADIYTVEPDFFFDAFAEVLARTPAMQAEFIEAFRVGDWMQIGALADRIFRNYLIKSPWLAERFQTIGEQNSPYEED